MSICGMHHDLNISYYDGQKLRYIKLERYLQKKHYLHWSEQDFDWSLLIIDSVGPKICEYLQSHFPELQIDYNELDALCLDSTFSRFNGIDNFSDENTLYYKYNNKIFVIDHHYLHALSCELVSEVPYDYSFVFDGKAGEYSSAVFRADKKIDHTHESKGSLGIGITLLGRQLNIKGHFLDVSGKLMGLQSYGNIDSRFLEKIQNYNLKNLGSSVVYGNNMYNINEKIKDNLTLKSGMFDISNCENKLDAAHTIHTYCGKLLVEYFLEHASPQEKISFSGGVAQNIIWNTQLKEIFPHLDVIPHCSDEGLSLGGIEFLRKHFSLPKIKLDNFPYSQYDEAPKSVASMNTIFRVSQLLSEGKIVAWYQGHGEVGPRALGNRSILMDPRIKDGKDKINKIKNREYYRPFGASILQEYAAEYFDLHFDNPYMLYIGKTLKPNLESITHVDGTCRAQTVSKQQGEFRLLLEEFHKITGCPVLLNTSLNVSGKPIAGNIVDAIEEFDRTDIDVLVIGDEIRIK
jgi:carbamoyltransferase